MSAALLLVLAAGLQAGGGAPDPVSWTSLPPIPDEVGLGGPFVATLEGAEGRQRLLVAGGANFPDAPPWEGGAKAWTDRSWVFAEGRWSPGPPLPAPRAYGAVVHLEDAVHRARDVETKLGV